MGSTFLRIQFFLRNVRVSLGLWSHRAPNYTEIQKELKWLKSDSGRPTPKWPKIDSKVTPEPIFESLLSHLNALWAGTLGVIFESLLGQNCLQWGRSNLVDPAGSPKNSFTKPGFWEHFVDFSPGKTAKHRVPD